MDDLRVSLIANPLTQRELEILRLVTDGLSNQEVSERLFITSGTVKWYLKHIYSKLGVGSRTQAIATARRLGLLGEKLDQPAQWLPRYNLPIQSTPFIGRTGELDS